ncbi:MBL fold metallo-hydrolase [Streptomyces antimicrobicus]|uniref:MBL fold metallo-hydrolase n=1 Tax=Streptomyces antimicrobicus TaxID=2883108 RepID=A0ABS8B321_9ACTN|nr:MBL fold metallo-hydrolase [Streptomyces antimicrobicus]MCB5179002.1 MBL fold metallo-hydrolase [Streptomyces antimicrobicus]
MPLSVPFLRIGSTEIIALPDGEGPFFSPRAEAFPGATAAQWAAADRYDPGAVDAEGRWRLRFRAYAIRGEKGVTVVDAGIGPADSPASSWAPVPGVLPASLAAAGIDPADVDTVVLTHLHTDHVGWAVVTEAAVPSAGVPSAGGGASGGGASGGCASGGCAVGDDASAGGAADATASGGTASGGTAGGRRPYFPNAHYLLQRAEFDALDTLNPQLRETLTDPLQAAGRLRLLDGDTPLRTGRVVATPGHTPGHQSVLVADGRESALVTGDLLVHALQLLHPELAYAHETDPEAARRSRERMLGRGAATTLHLATPHLTEPFHAV